MTDSVRPLVSIVTPSFNKGQFIEETIRSVLDQTYAEIEYIVIDGGSTDETLSILERYSDKVFWISEPDRGQSDAINKGWKMAKGEIIAYLNADDTYLPDAVGAVVSYLEAHPDTCLVYGDGILEDERGQKLRDFIAGPFDLDELIFCRNNILQPSVFFRRDLLQSIGLLDESLHLAMDLDYWIRVALVGRIDYLPRPLSAAKIYQDAKSSAFLTRYVEDYEHILRNVFISPLVPQYVLRERSHIYAYIYIKGGFDALWNGQIWLAVTYIRKGIRSNPLYSFMVGIRLAGDFGRKRFFRGAARTRSVT